MRYPAKLTPDGPFFMVTFPDVRGALTQGDNKEDALHHAVDALETALDLYFQNGRAIPLPSKPKRGDALVELPLRVVGKVLLHNEMVRQNVTPVALARLMSKRSQKRVPKIDLTREVSTNTVALAINALGKHLEVVLA